MTPPTSPAIEPFVGLRPFEHADAHLFFGREAQVEELLARLQAQRYVVVMGASGSGKSSLVRAGLIPALEGGGATAAGTSWRIALMRPGGNPIGNLADALARAWVPESTADAAAPPEAILEAVLRRGSLGLVDAVRESPLTEHDQLLIVVDQFEELFRFKRAGEVDDAFNHATAFVKLLLNVLRQKRHPVYVVLTMRSDALGSCAEFHELPELINEGLFLIPRLNRDQLAETIVEPAAVAHATVSPSLVQRLLNDVGDDPDQLPMLQHALMRMWGRLRDAGDGNQLTLRHYEAIKGLNDALSDHADEAYAELDARQQRIAEKTFKCLTERGPDNVDVRRPTTLKEICEVASADPDEVIKVIDHFRREGRSFVTTAGSQPLTADTFFDISHESLIRKWTRLQTWVNEEADDRKLFLRLSDSAAAHAAGKEAPWRNPLLGVGLEWHQRFEPTAAWARRCGRDLAPSLAFLDISRKEQRFRGYLQRAVFAALVLVAPIVWFVYHEIRDARVEARRAAEREALANREAQVAKNERTLSENEAKVQQLLLASAKSEAEQKKILAELAQERGRVAEVARDSLIINVSERLNQNGSEARVLVPLHVLRRTEGTASDVATDAEKSLRQGLPLLQQLRWSENQPVGSVTRLVTVSAQQRALVLAQTTSAVRLWDATATLPRRLPDLPVRPTLVISTAGRNLAWPSPDAIVVWNADSGQRIIKKSSPKDFPVSLASDASHIVVGGEGGTVLRSLQKDESTPLTSGPVDRAAFSADDRMLATLSAGRVQLWQVSPFKRMGEGIAVKLDGSIVELAFSPKGGYLALAAGNRAWIWAVQKNAQGEPSGLTKLLTGQGQDDERVNDIEFSPDDGYLAVAGASGRINIITPRATVLLFNITKRARHSTPAAAERVTFSGDGRLVASSLRDKTVRIWRLEGWTEIGRLAPATPDQPSAADDVHELAFLNRGGSTNVYRLVTADAAGAVRLWEVSELSPETDRGPLITQACSRLGRAMTADEWLLYFRTETYESPCPKLPLNPIEVLKLQIEYARTNEADRARAAFQLRTATQDVEPSLVLSAANAQFGVGNIRESGELFRLAGSLAMAKGGMANADKARLNNSVCWQGAIRNFPKHVLAACFEAVKLSPLQHNYKDSRGVALALLDNRPEAIADFETFVSAVKGDDMTGDVKKRVQWIAELKANRNPFVSNRDKVLEDLRDGT